MSDPGSVQGAAAPVVEAGSRSARSARAAWIALAITLAAALAAALVDRWLFQHVRMSGVHDEDWGRLLRVMGFIGTWFALALAVGLHDAGVHPPLARPRRRAWLLLLSPGLAGLAAEVLKILIRRERPGIHDGAYGFRPWSERTWSGAGLSLPSSHAAVAFGGAAMVAILFPRARWVGYALAAGCGLTRMLAGAHFLSDVVLAAGIGWLAAWWLSQRRT
jgi:membrane-associated phospholipid phosphatase